MSQARVAQFSALVQRQPDNELFRFSLAQALAADDRSSDAIPHLEFCVNKKADWMFPRIMLGKIHLAEGRPTQAKPLLEDALRLAVEQDHDDPAAELRSLLATL